jgi:hypothetical protein
MSQFATGKPGENNIQWCQYGTQFEIVKSFLGRETRAGVGQNSSAALAPGPGRATEISRGQACAAPGDRPKPFAPRQGRWKVLTPFIGWIPGYNFAETL